MTRDAHVKCMERALEIRGKWLCWETTTHEDLD